MQNKIPHIVSARFAEYLKWANSGSEEHWILFPSLSYKKIVKIAIKA